MYDVYGIVKVEKCSNNKGLKLYLLVTSFLLYCLSVQRLGNPKMSVVYHSAPDINNNTCDTAPLDKLKYYSTNKPALPYITFICVISWFSQEQNQFLLGRQAFVWSLSRLLLVWGKCFPNIVITKMVYGKMCVPQFWTPIFIGCIYFNVVRMLYYHCI